MAVRVPDIAKFVGLSAPSVYQILANPDHPRYSVATKQRVLKAAEDLGYQPNSAAKALSTKRTGHIGFILSDTVADGWANPFYATCLCGVESACRKRGYGLNVSLYNLSNVDSFVFPTKVGQRCVDGLILADYVESAVVQRFREFDIPCVCIGDNTEVGELIPTVALDIITSEINALKYAARLGHRRIALHFPTRRPDREVAECLVRRIKLDPELMSCQVEIMYTPLNAADYSAARPLMKSWLAIPVEQRPTVVVATDQTIVAFLKEMSELGLRCPENISLISGADTRLCEMAIPGITAIHYDLAQLGSVAVHLLLDHLDLNKPLTKEMSRKDFIGEFIIRQSCQKLSAK
jgi:DNA-binding LacI/PurR family transcriptional regulator